MLLASRTIQLRQAHILPSGWNQVSMETKSPLHDANANSQLEPNNVRGQTTSVDYYSQS